MMYETKLIKVDWSNWQRYIPSLAINLLVLLILSLGALTNSKRVIAQVAANESNPKQEANRNNVQTTLEPKILAEINRVRTNPQDYAQWLEKQRQYYDGIWLRLPGERAVRTNKGKKALEEAIAFLKEQQPLPALKTSPQASEIASSELENFATAKNIQYFSYGRKTVQGIVMGLVVDDLFPDRRRRASLLNPDVENTGVVCKSDPRYAKVCAIAYSDLAGTTDIAEVKPETTKPGKDAVVNVPEILTTSESLETPENPENPETTKPEAASATPEETEKTEKTEETEKTDNTDTATLPVPPQPQVPPVPNSNREEKPDPSAEVESKDLEDIEVAQTEANESEAEAAIEDETAETESALEIEPEVESNTEEVVEDDSESVTDEAEAEIAEIIEEDDSEQVAINNDRLLEKVERGALEKGDRIIEDDGSLYDFYPLQGKAGDSFNIYLESDQFDTFVALVDSNGNTIKENDDISEEDSNSRIRVKLPEDGTYNIIVNTYDEQGTGQYVLTVSR